MKVKKKPAGCAVGVVGVVWELRGVGRQSWKWTMLSMHTNWPTGLVSEATASHHDLQAKISFLVSYIPKTWRMEGMKMSFISYFDDLHVLKGVLLDIRASRAWQMTLLLCLISGSHRGVANKICYVLNCHRISAPFPLLYHMPNQQINHAKDS